MRTVAIAVLMTLAAGCSMTGPAGVKPLPAGESRRDAVVAMAASDTLYNPASPDWSIAAAEADRRCRGWGRARATFAGWQEACRIYDFHGRCADRTITRFFTCGG